jgi:hypothetical protein
MSKALALQKAMRAAFVASPAVLALVPAARIVDRHLRPAPSPSVIIGEAVAAPDEGNVSRDRREVFADLHIWVAEQSTEVARRIMAALADALTMDPRPQLDGGFHLVDWTAWRERVLRDPSGDTSHGILTVRAIIGGAGA